MHQPRPTPSARAQRLEQLATAIDTHRAGRARCRIPRELRAQVIAAIDAGVPSDVVRKACKLSAWQITSWTQDPALNIADAAAPRVPPRVLSVVDRTTREDTMTHDEIELRIGGWHVSFRRVQQ